MLPAVGPNLLFRLAKQSENNLRQGSCLVFVNPRTRTITHPPKNLQDKDVFRKTKETEETIEQ
jgi:hypothetical protein